MSVLAVNPHDTNAFFPKQHFFYKKLNNEPKNANSLIQPKRIIPAIPRQHFKAPKNSSLSPIRSQKVVPKKSNHSDNNSSDDESLEFMLTSKRPYQFITAFSAPASNPSKTSNNKKQKKRVRKVNFNSKVTVVCTQFDDYSDEEDEQEQEKRRRHSTGETANLKSILIQHSCLKQDQEAPLVIKKRITKSLKQFKNRLLFI